MAKKYSEEEALKLVQALNKKEMERDVAEKMPMRTILGASQDNRRMMGADLYNHRTNSPMLARHGMKIFAVAAFFTVTSIFYFSGMTVEAKYADGKRICVNCRDQNEEAKRRWFSPPTIPEPPELPDALRKTKMIP